MNTESVLFQAILNCAKRYNRNDFLEWGDRLTYTQQCKQVANELKKMGYCINKGDDPIINELKSVLTNEGK